MANVPDNQNPAKGGFQEIIDQKVIDISAQLAEVDSALQKLNKDQLTAEEVLEKERLQKQQERLNKKLKIETRHSAEYEKTRRAVDERLHTLKLRAETKAIQDLAELEAAGMEVNLQLKAKLQQKYMQEEITSRLKDEIQLLEEISKSKEKQRQKEIEVLERRKEVLNAERKASDAKDAVKEAKKSGDKGKVKEAKKEAKAAKKDEKKKTKEISKSAKKSGGVVEAIKQLRQDAKDQAKDEEALSKINADNSAKAMKALGKSITAGLNAINDSITSYAKHQTAVNARLNGLKGYSGGGNIFQSAGYGKIADNLNKIAFSPLLNAEELYNNVAEIVGQGIAVNIEQRAMFATLKDGIATTFDVTSESLKRIIRLQQNDSTAARLGLEAYLTEFLNVYTQNTEYLQQTFDSVADSLLEASALMKHNSGDAGVAESLEFEFQVQKWLGTLTGYGFSEEASQNIANAIGQLATGNVDSLVSSDINNLLLMAANKGGVSYSDMLSNGMTADDVNNLMYGVVSYMQEVAETDNNIIKNQLAKVFGVGITDLIAATNIQTGVLEDLKNESLTYNEMYGALEDNFNELPARLGISNILENAFANMSYQTGANIAKNPALYAMWKITDMIQQNTGGIAIPALSVYGNGFDLETTVENLMKIGIAGTALLGNIGGIISGVASLGSGSSLLRSTGVSMDGASIKQIEGGLSKTDKNGKRSSGDSSSGGAVVGNSDGDTYQDSAVNDAEDDAQKKLDKKKEEERDAVVIYLEDEVEFITKLETIIQGLTQIDTTLKEDVISAISTLDTDVLQALTKIDADLLVNVGANQQVSATIQSVLSQLSALGDNAVSYYAKSLTLGNAAYKQTTTVSTSGWKSAADYKQDAAEPTGSGQAQGAAAGAGESQSTVINNTTITGLTQDELHSEMEPIVNAIEALKSNIELLKNQSADQLGKLTTIDSTLAQIYSVNSSILNSLPEVSELPIEVIVDIPELSVDVVDNTQTVAANMSNIDNILAAIQTIADEIAKIGSNEIHVESSPNVAVTVDLDVPMATPDINVLMDAGTITDAINANYQGTANKLSAIHNTLTQMYLLNSQVANLIPSILSSEKFSVVDAANQTINLELNPDINLALNPNIQVPEFSDITVEQNPNVTSNIVAEAVAANSINNQSNSVVNEITYDGMRSISSIADNVSKILSAVINLGNMPDASYSSNDISTAIKSSYQDYSINVSSTMIESLVTSIKTNDQNDMTEMLKTSIDSIVSAATTNVTVNLNDVAIPKAERSQLSSGDVNNISNDVSETILNSNAAQASDAYITSSIFANDFKSIVDNVAKIAGTRNVKEWSNPASGQATGSFGSNTQNQSNSDSIDGLTQYTDGQNPLFF